MPEYKIKHIGKKEDGTISIIIPPILDEDGDIPNTKIDRAFLDVNHKQVSELIDKYDHERKQTVQILQSYEEKYNKKEENKTGISVIDNLERNIAAAQLARLGFRHQINEIITIISELENKLKQLKGRESREARKRIKVQIKQLKKLLKQYKKSADEIKSTLKKMKAMSIAICGIATLKTLSNIITHLVNSFTSISPNLIVLGKKENWERDKLGLPSKMKKIYQKTQQIFIIKVEPEIEKLTLLEKTKVESDKIENKDKINDALEKVISQTLVEIENLIKNIIKAETWEKIVNFFESSSKKIEKVRKHFLETVEKICKENEITDEKTIKAVQGAALAELYIRIINNQELHKNIVNVMDSEASKYLKIAISCLVTTMCGIIIIGLSIIASEALFPVILGLGAAVAYGSEGAAMVPATLNGTHMRRTSGGIFGNQFDKPKKKSEKTTDNVEKTEQSANTIKADDTSKSS